MDFKKITEHITKRIIIVSLIMSLLGTWLLTMVVYENTTFSTKIFIFIILLILTLSRGVCWRYIKMKMNKK